MSVPLSDMTISFLAKALQPRYSSIAENYSWKVNLAKLPFDVGVEKGMSLYQTNLAFRAQVSKMLKESNKSEQELWYRRIIQDWGGIKSFKDLAWVSTFLKELDMGKLSWKSSNRISSLSKVAAFTNPEKYGVYDARVSLALNWLLYLETDHEGPFFKDLSKRSRNTKIIPPIKWDRTHTRSGSEIIYMSNSTFYFTYNALLRALANLLGPDDDRSFERVEMTLFSIPETDYRKEILSHKNA